MVGNIIYSILRKYIRFYRSLPKDVVTNRHDAEGQIRGKKKIVDGPESIRTQRSRSLTVVLDLEAKPNVTSNSGPRGSSKANEVMMVFLEEPRMIFADMRLDATSTPTCTPTRYLHQKYRPQNNNNCTICRTLNSLVNLELNLGISSTKNPFSVECWVN